MLPKPLHTAAGSAALALAAMLLACTAAGQTPNQETSSASQAQATRQDSSQTERQPQPRPHGERVTVDPAKVIVDDGDTIDIDWGSGGLETIRILGIDTPETRHVPHNLPYAQSFGPVASGFAQGAFAAATKVELLRSSTLDPYGRTLGYVFVNDMNYSVLVIRARLAVETVSHYGDNGFPKESKEVLAAAKAAGPAPFEAPFRFRQRMRDVSDWMKKNDIYPEQ